MKVGQAARERTPKTTRGKRRPVTSAPFSFLATLSQAEKSVHRQSLATLMAEVEKHGAQLKEKPTLQALLRYKELIRQFLAQALGELYRVEEVASWVRRGRYKAYLIVRRLNQALEELTFEYITQKGQLELVAKLDEIRGLLLDLYT